MKPNVKSPHVTLAFLMGSSALSRLSSLLISDAYVWQFAAFNDAVTIAIAVTLAAILIPYRALRAKSLTSALAAVAWLEVVYLALHYSFGLTAYNYWLVFQLVTFISVTAFYWSRPYYEPSTPVDTEHVFLLSRKPHTPLGFYISLLGFFGTYGGFAVYANGLLYSYRKGKFDISQIEPRTLSNYQIKRGGKINDELLTTLTKLSGKPWSLRTNCLQLRAIWERHNGIIENAGYG